MSSWPLEIDGRTFEPIPDSWFDWDFDDGRGGPRLYAVSAAVSGRDVLHVRYLHPTTPKVGSSHRISG